MGIALLKTTFAPASAQKNARADRQSTRVFHSSSAEAKEAIATFDSATKRVIKPKPTEPPAP